MRTQGLFRVIAAVGFAVWSDCSWAQTSGVGPGDALVDMVLWGAHLKIDPDAYSPEIKAEVDKHLQRSAGYRSERRRPTNSSELEMVFAAQVGYERRLVAVSDDPMAPALARAYVDSLRPCYEWEGFHDCPEREAVFATEYQTAHPGGPFSEFLPLLAAHRWLCAAEGYDYERQPEGAARSRRAYEQAISSARQSTAPLIRLAAEGLTARGRCFSQR
jgi:hypothetical protein